MKTPPELQNLADQIGSFIEYWGFKKIHGKIWAHLYLSDVPLSTADLMARLKVSKGLMSICMNELIDYEVIQEVSKGKNGTVFYQANANVNQVIINVLRTRERRMLGQISSSFRLLESLGESQKSAFNLNEASVDNMGQMIEGAENALDSLIALNEAGADLISRFQELSPFKSV